MRLRLQMEDEISFKLTDNNNFFEAARNCHVPYIRRNKAIWLKITDYGIKYLDVKILRVVCGVSERLIHYIGRKCCTRVFTCRHFVEEENFEMVKLYNDYEICNGYRRSWSYYRFKSTEMIDLMGPHFKDIQLIKTYGSMKLGEMMNPIFQHILKYTSDCKNKMILKPECKNFLVNNYGVAGENFVRNYWIDLTICKTFVFAENDVDGILTLNGRDKYYDNIIDYVFVADEVMKTYSYMNIAESTLNFVWFIWKQTVYFGHRSDCDKNIETCKCCEWLDVFITILSNVLIASKKLFPEFKVMWQKIDETKMRFCARVGECDYGHNQTFQMRDENRIDRKFAQLISCVNYFA